MKTLYKTIIHILVFIALNYTALIFSSIIGHTPLYLIFYRFETRYESYVFILTIIFLFYLACLKTNYLSYLIFIGIPLVGFVASLYTYPYVEEIYLIKSYYCFRVYTLTGVVCIILGNVIFKNRK
jgi:hypothetical protein